MSLKLVGGAAPAPSALTGTSSFDPQAIADHQQLVDEYIGSHRIRNHSLGTIRREQDFLRSWFDLHGAEGRPLYTWEAMEPIVGRKRVRSYAHALYESGLGADTVRGYLGILSRYFSYVLEHPFLIHTSVPVKLQDRYGFIEQPISEYDMPKHTYDGERLGLPLDPERLYDFFAALRCHYLNPAGGYAAVRARNYAMAVLAGESGLRADELFHLETRHDLFFESKKLQTRHAKGTYGSGKRARITLFTPLARDTIQHYLREHRPKLEGSAQTDLLFPSRAGNRLTYTAAHHALQEMIRAARDSGFGINTHMSWHWFRRIFATRFIERFPNQLSVLINLLGHLSPNTVHHYIRHSEAWMGDQIQSVLEGSGAWPSTGD